MAENKKSFIAYSDWQETFEELSDEEAGKLVKHLFNYVNDKNPEASDKLTKMCFIPIKQSLKRDLVKYDNYIDKQRVNGKKGGRPKKNPTLSEETQPFLEKPKKADSVNDSVSVNESDTNKQKTKKEKIEGFLKWFNSQKKVHTGTLGKFKMLTKTDENNLFKLLKVYNHKDFKEAIPKMYASNWAKENQMFTPTHFLRNDNFNKYLNQELVSKFKANPNLNPAN